MTSVGAAFPRDLTGSVVLTDGTSVLLRAVVPEDADRFERLFWRLSPESLYRRFLAPVTRPAPAVIRWLVNVDYRDRLALLALVDDEVVGVARYERLSADVPVVGAEADMEKEIEAEAAVIVEDAWQGRGVGTHLLTRLAAAAAERGIAVFTAEVLGDNRRMMGLLAGLAPEVSTVLRDGRYVVRIRLLPRPP